tara:strand:- start:489 stop:671 length:183 start_codon:yes stop_codon:yes gene_type:complete
MDKHFYTFIIEKLKERERMEREQSQRIPLQIPLPLPPIEKISKIEKEEEKPNRGVTIIEM